MKEIPDFDLDVSQATQYIFESDLAQKAFSDPPFLNYTNICRDLVQQISRLSNNCNMPEFTNHGLQHICSLIKRASEWGVEAGWLDELNRVEVGYLLLAILIHDMGMLSQDPKELPDGEMMEIVGGESELAGWVRRTHVKRLPKLMNRLLKKYLPLDGLDMVIHMAASHSYWPWEMEFEADEKMCQLLGLDPQRIMALQSIIAVCDLLDESADRCDSATLLEHKYGTTLNRAHWYRHALTASVEGVHKNGVIDVRFRNLQGVPPEFQVVFRALRNHFRLVLLYNENLHALHAEIQQINFYPSNGSPQNDGVSERLGGWQEDVEFQYCMTARILDTFLPEARNEATTREMRMRLANIGMESMDLSKYALFLHPKKPYLPEEKLLYAIIEEAKNDPSGVTTEKLNRYASSIVEQAYLRGEIGKVKNLCGLVREHAKELIEPENWYWIDAYMLELEDSGDEFGLYRNFPAGDGVYARILQTISLFVNLENYEIFSRTMYYYREIVSPLLETDFSRLHKDTPTELLLHILVGSLFYYANGNACDLRNEILKKLRTDFPPCESFLQEEIKRLSNQFGKRDSKRTFDGPFEQEMYNLWNFYLSENTQKLKQTIFYMMSKLDRNHPYFVSFQKLVNVSARSIDYDISLQKRETDEIEQQVKAERLETDDYWQGSFQPAQQEPDTDRLRLYQQQTDKPQHGIHVLRMDNLEKMLIELENKYAKGEVIRENIAINQLLFLELLYTLKNWDIVQWVVLHRYCARYYTVIGLSFRMNRDERQHHYYMEQFLAKAIEQNIYGLESAPSEKNKEYWLGIVASFSEETKQKLFQELFQIKDSIFQPILRSWIEELGQYVPKEQLDTFVDWIIQYEKRGYTSYVVYYAFPMKVCKPLFERKDITPEHWKKLSAVFEKVLRNDQYWFSESQLCEEMLLHMSKEKQLTILQYAVQQKEENDKRKTSQIINMALKISRQNPELADTCADYLRECANEDDDREELLKYAKVITVARVDELSKPNVELIKERMQVIFRTRNEECQNTYMQTISMLDELGELFNNENWNVISDSEFDELLHILRENFNRMHNQLLANEIFSFYRVLLKLAKKTDRFSSLLDAAKEMNPTLKNPKLYSEYIRRNRARMPLPTNLNNGYAYGFLYFVANLIEFIDAESLCPLLDWCNATYVFSEHICEYFYAYIWIYADALADTEKNDVLQEKAGAGLNQLMIKLQWEQEKSFEDKEDTLLSVLSAMHSFVELSDTYERISLKMMPEYFENFLEAGKNSLFYKKQHLANQIYAWFE